ncbi:MAG: DUF4433 domain-containing protein [Chlorobium phaeovibrioides]|nr:DUF4433 domain-containing protein [Chlorobium phaeovibrioides]
MQPSDTKIYHIVHIDKLASVLEDGHLWCDAEVERRASSGTGIGMADIKQRRRRLPLDSRPGLHVGECVPFYFCPRSVMLFMLHRENHPQLSYHGGQGPIVHLEVDLQKAVAWAEDDALRWAFTLTNAGSVYFEDRSDLRQLVEIDWDAVNARNWRDRKEGKQAEFLLEQRCPFELVERVGVHSPDIHGKVQEALGGYGYDPLVEVRRDWYY